MSFPHPLPPLEMWGGVECTINRVGDTYFDQLKRNGHHDRIDDLYRFAELGIRAIRYPIQWERIAPHGLAQANWSWADERLNLLRTLGITPIVGLTHHGSGPRSTSLIEASFVEGLTQYAEAVAKRYPWVEHYTPVNEPLTTARFSGLYGHWYPHGRDRHTFARALLTQCRAVVLSMQAIRQVNPHAKLIQTEDMGKVFSTPLLEAQAEMENERRWLTFDLLCGRLDNTKLMWHFLLASGCNEAELAWFLEHPCPPDILGIDYYPTSERFLDEGVDHYPSAYHTHNGHQKYADVEVVRVNTGTSLPVGYYERMQEAWQRYKLPMAITEAHLGSTREEQVRWLVEAWNVSQTLRQEGVQVRAVTAWSLLGAYDWNNLVTRITNFYEPGVFDVRSTKPRPTALARVAQKLAYNQPLDEPVLAQSGWWSRPDRFLYQSSLVPTASPSSSKDKEELSAPGRPVVIIGDAKGLGTAFVRQCAARHLSYLHITQEEMDKLNADTLRDSLLHLQPWALISTAGCELYASDESRSSIASQALLADICTQQNIALLAFSSDLVFDGMQATPYVESTPVTPRCQQGYMQAEMEEQVLQHCPSALVIRTGALLNPWSLSNAEEDMLPSAIVNRSASTTLSFTYMPDLVHVCLDLLVDGESGLWHLTNPGTRTWSDFVYEVTGQEGVEKIHTLNRERMRSKQQSSLHSFSCVLQSERGQILPSLDDALSRYRQERSA